MSVSRHLIKLSGGFTRSWLMTRRNGFTVFEVIFWPVVNLLSIGLMTAFLDLRPDTVIFVLTGTMALSVVQVCQLDVAYAVLFDMWAKSVKHQFAAPVEPWHVAGGGWLMGLIRGGLVFAIQGLTARAAFGVEVWAGAPAFLAGLLLSALAVGLVVSALLLSFGLRAEVSAWSSVSLVLLVCGVYYPVSILPAPLRAVATGVPITYFLEAFRQGHGFAPLFSAPLTRGFALAGAYVAVGYLAFAAAVERARRTGMLLKLSD